MFGDPLGNKYAWQSSIFGAEFDIYSGGTPKTNVAEYWDGGTIPWIGSNMCQNNVLETNDGKFITEKGLKESSAKWAHSGFV